MEKSSEKTHPLSSSPDEIKRAFKASRGGKTDLFVYGTLMDDSHVRLLLKRIAPSVPAKLYNYMRVAPAWSFPFIVKQHGAVTGGRILKGLSREDIKVLDDFEVEGHLFKRQSTVVRTARGRQRCMTYVGNISALEKSFGREVKFEDRYSRYIEKKVDAIIADMNADKSEMTRRVIHELMGSAVDEIIQSHFDGNYICNYIMVQALEDAKPPHLKDLLKNKELLPYAGNYMRLACQHIVFNQLVEAVRHEYLDAVRIAQPYFRHGLSILLAMLYYNRHAKIINELFREKSLDTIVEGRNYRDYARSAVEIADSIYNSKEMQPIIEFVEENWYVTPTPLGAELEFSCLGKRAVYAQPGEDKMYDGFYWFKDFDMFRRTWRLGGHVDSHQQITVGQERHRGFFEYALGRYQIVGDLSRPLFACPWGMSVLINEAVKFANIPPHSLHISMELQRGKVSSNITDRQHQEEDLACLLLLGGDIRPDSTGKLREWRVFDGELDTNVSKSLNFSDRKFHFTKPDQDESEASDVMEYKFVRLKRENTDYESLIIALKGYQFGTRARPIKTQTLEKEMPEQAFLRAWAANPQPLDSAAINKFIEKVENGLLEENNIARLPSTKQTALRRVEDRLLERNSYVSKNK
ncbi:MAG: gamma-glutamylcyclotransferase family protein [Lentisphaerota bacterium]